MRRDVNGLQVLDATESLRLLRTQSLGRIGITSGALPVVLPVHFVVVDDQIVIHTRHSTQLAAATQHAIVAFEVDQFDPTTGAGWSVMVQGVARELSHGVDLVDSRAETSARWIDPADRRHVAISIDVVSGRRVDEAMWLPAGEEPSRADVTASVGSSR